MCRVYVSLCMVYGLCPYALFIVNSLYDKIQQIIYFCSCISANCNQGYLYLIYSIFFNYCWTWNNCRFITIIKMQSDIFNIKNNISIWYLNTTKAHIYTISFWKLMDYFLNSLPISTVFLKQIHVFEILITLMMN